MSKVLIRKSHPDIEGVMQVSKWLKLQLLLDEEEMQALIASLEPFYILKVSSAIREEEALVSSEEFIKVYAEYISSLKRGELPNPTLSRDLFSSIFTLSLDDVYAIPFSSKILVKPLKPVIQLQSHHFTVSNIDGKIFPMSLGKESITWGIQFSYPQIYLHPHTGDFHKVNLPEFPNTHLYKKMVGWMRQETIPTPFLVSDKKINAPIRLGKKCLSWISSHPQLKLKFLEVVCGY